MSNLRGTVTCHRCGAKVAAELQKLPPEQCGGRENFWFYEVECPECGHELEGVLKEKV